MNVATHAFLPEEVMAFLDGELSPEESASISAHLEACSNCKELTGRLRTTSQSLLRWQTDELKSSLQEPIMENAANRQSGTSARLEWLRNFQLFFSRPLPWALACLTMVVLIGARFFGSAPILSPRNKPEEYRSVLRTDPPSPSGNHDTLGDKVAAGGGGEYAFSSSQPSGSPRAQASDATKLPSLPSGPMIARTAALSIFVKDFDAGRASLDAIL